jgi:hypothetical protein
VKKKNKCPKCGAKEAWTDYQNWSCGSNDKAEFGQSDLCRERVKVQKLKRKVERLTAALDTETRAVDQLRRELVVLRNPNF